MTTSERWTTTRAWGFLALAAATIAGGACGSGEASEAPAYQTITAERRSLEITVEATGTVEPVRTVEVKSKASGEILDLHVDVGDQVAPGTLLAEIDPRDVRNAYEQAEADLDVARARLEIAGSQLRRSEELLEAGVVTAEEHEGKNLEYANARASLVKAETNLELADQRLGDATIEAPMAGTVLTKDVEDGQVIQSASANISGGTTLFVMANLDSMQVRTLVDETDMGQVEAGMAASVRVEAYPDLTFEGVVRKVEPQAVVEQSVTMFPVIVNLDNREGRLRPGMNAEVVVHVAREPDVVTVPTNAVVELGQGRAAAEVLGLDPEAGEVDRRALLGMTGGGASRGPSGAPWPSGGEEENLRAALQQVRLAFVRSPDGALEARPVRIGLSDWDFVQVVAGLEEGEEVAVIGAAQLRAQQDEFLQRIRDRRGGPF